MLEAWDLRLFWDVPPSAKVRIEVFVALKMQEVSLEVVWRNILRFVWQEKIFDK